MADDAAAHALLRELALDGAESRAELVPVAHAYIMRRHAGNPELHVCRTCKHTKFDISISPMKGIFWTRTLIVRCKRCTTSKEYTI